MEGTGVCQHGGARSLKRSPKPAALFHRVLPHLGWEQYPNTWGCSFPRVQPPCPGTQEQPSPPPPQGEVIPTPPRQMHTSWLTPCRKQHLGGSKGNFSFSRQKLGCNFTPALGSRTISAQSWLSSKRPLPQAAASSSYHEFLDLRNREMRKSEIPVEGILLIVCF